jgi:hypothetical protein
MPLRYADATTTSRESGSSMFFLPSWPDGHREERCRRWPLCGTHHAQVSNLEPQSHVGLGPPRYLSIRILSLERYLCTLLDTICTCGQFSITKRVRLHCVAHIACASYVFAAVRHLFVSRKHGLRATSIDEHVLMCSYLDRLSEKTCASAWIHTDMSVSKALPPESYLAIH